MADHSPSTVRAAALRRSALSLAKAFSIGLKSGAVRRQVEQPRAFLLDHGAHPRPLVAGQVVHDHDVACLQLGDEDACDVGLERLAVDRAVEDEGRDEPARAQPGNKGRGLPVSMRYADPQALPARGSSVAPGHVGGSPGLVDEHEAPRVEVELILEPGFAPLQDVRAVLL